MKKNSQGKKLISLALAFALLISLFSILPLTASAAVGDTEVVDGVTYSVTNADTCTASATKFDGSIKEVKIKDKVNIKGTDYTVTAIGINTFANKNITSISIPETITENIKDSSFYKCIDLKDVYIYSPAQLQGDPFTGCKSLQNLYCYNDKTDFGFGTLSMSGIVVKNFKIHGHTGSTAETFAKSKNYTFVVLSDGGTTTAPATTKPVETTAAPATFKEGNFTFTATGTNNNVNVTGFDNKTTDVVIPEKVNHDGVEYKVVGLKEYLFLDNTYIKSINIPGTVTTVSSNLCLGCKSLASVTFNEGTKTIGGYAFFETALTSVEFPKSIETISDCSFNTIATLKEIKINSNAKILMRAFGGDPSLRSIYCYADDISFVNPDKIFMDATTREETSTKRITIYGNTGSTAQDFAENKGITFKALDGESATTTAAETTATVATQATTVAAETTVAPETTTPVATEATEATQATTVVPETTILVGTIEVLLGDADGSQKVDVKDVTHIQKHIAAYFTLEGANALAADVDGSGVIDVNDVTYVQKYLAAYKVDYKIGEVVQFGSDTPAPTAETPQPTDEQPTTSAQDPTTAEPEPTTAEPEPTVPENSTRFYIPNYVSWLNNDGCKLWLYNDDTDGLLAATEYESNPDGVAGYFYFDLPNDWVNISIYRTAYEITPETFDKDSPWDEATKTGVILNSWLNIGDRGENNAYKIIGDGEPGVFETFDPDEKKPDENERTIYFDNSKTHWATVYVYGWSYGLNQEWAPMEFEGDDIWSYTFYDDLPVDGVTGFLFVNQSDVWDGARQTADMATEAGKNLFVPSGAGNVGQKLTGTWDVYNP